MLREIVGVVLFVASGGLLSGCWGIAAAIAQADGCPELKPYCLGDFAVTSSYENSTDCGLTTTYEVDCDEDDMTCRDGACVARPKERCPNGGDGVCRDGRAIRCEGEFLSAHIDVCAALGIGTQCRMVPGENGHAQPVCSLSDEPCAVVAGDGAECQGTTRVSCVNGYPVEKEVCDGPDEVCLVVSSTDPDGAVCALDLPCPSAGTACDGDRVYGCRNGVPEILRDCAVFSTHCVETNGRGLCAVDEAGPRDIAFRPIEGGTFQMARSGVVAELADYEMLETEVTVAQYAACEAAGRCSAPAADCRIEFTQRKPWFHGDLPVTCVTFAQAAAFCDFVGGEVPSDVEWEYALRNGGDDVTFPWGEGEATCVEAILSDPSGPGCGRGEPWPGCSRPSDVTEQGVCDLVGNVEEWVTILQSDVEWPGERGGSYQYVLPDPLVSGFASAESPALERGFRCVRLASP